MKRYLALALLVLVPGAVLFGTIHWSLGTCRLLDRMLGLSGCRGSVAVTGFSVIRNVTMSTPDDHGISSLFGSALTAEGAAPAMIRLDPSTGREIARYPLRLQFDVRRVTFAEDGGRAALDCLTVRRCTERGNSISIVSLNDGAEIETRDAWRESPRFTLGDPVPGPPFSSDATVADAGNRIVDRDENALRIYTPGGKAVAEIGIWNRWTPPRLTISPSGRYVAFVDEDPNGEIGQEFHVWDVRDGTRRATIKTGADYHSDANLVWSADETSVFAFRKEGEDTYIDRFVVPGT